MARNIAFSAIAGAVLVFAISCSDETISHPRPNVLFISIDTLRADHLGAYGGTAASTPTLDALARDGVLFARAVAHVPMTLPSHASMFTSLIPPAHGVRDNGTFVLEGEHTTVAELLRDSGYSTGAFVGAFVLDRQFGLAQGFDVYDDDVEATPENDRPADVVLDNARAWLEEVDDARPWFAFVHLFDPHAPYDAPPPFGVDYRESPYAGEVAYVDDAIGRFLGGFETLDDTLVVVTADHGEGLGEHGERTHGMFTYDSTMHVPLILRWPNGLARGRRVATRVRHIDIAPTIAALARVDPPPSFHGRSLVPLFEGDAEPDRVSYFESLTYSFNYGFAPLRGLYRGSYKYVSLPIPELYDLSNDGDETTNLAERRAGTVAEMDRALSELVAAELPSSALPANVAASARHRLETLGYISGSNPLPAVDEYGPADDPKRWVHLADMLDEAVAHHRASRPAAAIELLRAIVAEKNDVAIAHARLARILGEEGRTPEAIAVLEEALAKGVHHPNIITALGALLREAGDEEGWGRVLEDVIARNPDDADAHEALASTFMRRELPARAIPHLERVVEIDPERYGTLVQLGLLEAELGRTPQAIGYLRRFVALAPDETYGADKTNVRAFIDELERADPSP